MDIPFFLLIGQSNIAGRGNVGDLAPEEKIPQNGLYNLVQNLPSSYQYQPATHSMAKMNDPFFPARSEQEAVGPGLFFASEMRAKLSLENLGIVLCAPGGVGLDKWDVVSDQPQNKVLYSEAVGRAKVAQKLGACLGVLVYIGEADSHTQESASAWGRRFKAMVESIRQELNMHDLPVVMAEIGRISDERKQAFQDKYGYWDEVKTGQRSIDMPRLKKISTEDLELAADGIHLTTAAQRILGTRFADAMAELILKEKAA